MDEIEKQAQAVAARVPATVGFEPAAIIGILTVVLPMLMKCFQRNDEPSPADMRANIKLQNEQAPAQLRRRTARRIRGDANEPMTRAQSFALAEAVVEEAISTDDATMASLAAACQE